MDRSDWPVGLGILAGLAVAVCYPPLFLGLLVWALLQCL